MPIEFEPLKPRIYINSFPKSGTHLAILMTLHMAKPQKPKHWLGSFDGNSWTKNWISTDAVSSVIRGQPEGTWMMGHMGYRPEFEKAFLDKNTCMIFVYRDLRDVAVSQTYHIENEDDDRFKHPEKSIYTSLPTHEDRIKAVIEGIDKYPGIVERWKFYAPWLDCKWVFPVKFEEMRENPKEIASKVVDYVVYRSVNMRDGIPIFVEPEYKRAIYKTLAQMKTTEHSGSFRKGIVGSWKEEFTPSILKSFEDTGGNKWLERLGYEI